MIRPRAETSRRGCGCLSLLLAALLSSVVLVGVVWLARSLLMTAVASVLVEDDGVQHADVAVVLGGDEYGTRVLRAAELARRGYVPYVLVSHPTQFGLCGSGISYAVDKSYPTNLFKEFAHSAQSTRDEVAFLDTYFHANGIHKILLVTSNFHTHRAAYLMRHRDPALQVVAIPSSDPYFSPSTWWQTREGQKTFLLEWTKTLATWSGH